jgi:glucokinase
MARVSAKPVVGVDLGGTNMQIGVVDIDGQIVGRARLKTKADEGQNAVIRRLVEGIRSACEEAKVDPSKLAGVGIGAPGAIDGSTGTVLEAVNLRWNDVPLARLVRDRLKPGGKVVLANDVDAAIYGEWRVGAARGATDVLGVWIGTGIGGGLILNGKLYSGGFHTAGEIGHTQLVLGAPLGRRTLEQNCSRTAIVERLVMLIRANHKTRLLDFVELKPEKGKAKHVDASAAQMGAGDGESGGSTGGGGGELDDRLKRVGSKTIAQAFLAGDRLTIQVVEEAAHLISISIANMVTVLSLPTVVLGGGLTEAIGEPWVKLVRRNVRELTFPERAKAVDVLSSKLDDDAGLLGAAMLARDQPARVPVR